VKITIETEDGKPSVAGMDEGRGVTGAESREEMAPPPEVAARAAAAGALSAGAAPAEVRGEQPPAFTPQPGTPGTTVEGQGEAQSGLAAGGAPDLGGQVEEVEVPVDESAEGEPEE
jgi:hypothetical protein